MKKIALGLILTAFVWFSTAAQTTDSLQVDSIYKELPEVTVKGERPIVKIEGGALVYDVPQLIEKKGVENLYDALKELPGVVELNGSLTLGGNGVNIILDNKATTMSAEQMATLLKSIPASRAEKAEVIFNAPAKYQLRGAVINVKLKQPDKHSPSLQGELNTFFKQKHYASLGERAAILYHNSKFSMDLIYQFHHEKSYFMSESTSHHALADGTLHDIWLTNRNQQLTNSHAIRLGMDFHLSDKHLLSVVYNGDFKPEKSHGNSTGYVVSRGDYSSDSHLHNLRADYQLPFGTKIGAEMTNYFMPQTQEHRSKAPANAFNYRIRSSQRINRWKLFLSQEHQFKHDFELNYGAILTTIRDHSTNSYTPLGDNTITVPVDADSRRTEKNVNLYIGIDKKINDKWSFNISVAAEYFNAQSWNEWTLYPTARLSWNPSPDHIVQLGFYSDKKYPAFWEQNNFIAYQTGGYDRIVGNPFLKPSKIYKTNIIYILKGKYQIIFDYQHQKNYMVQTLYQRHDQLIADYKSLNFDFNQQISLNIYVPFKLGNWLNSSIFFTGVWQREKDSDFYDIPFDRHVFWVLTMFNNTFTLSSKPNVTLSIDGMVRSKAIQGTYDLPSSSNLNLSACWSFFKKRATLRLYCNDIFQNNGISPRIDYKNQRIDNHYSNFRECGLSFTYRFGGYKEKTRKEVDTERMRK